MSEKEEITAATKLSIEQSSMLDDMARFNNTSRSKELRWLLVVHGRERLDMDKDEKELVDAEKACMHLFELYKRTVPLEGIDRMVYLWFTGLPFYSVQIIGLLVLEKLNKTQRKLIFRFTNKYRNIIVKYYPEFAPNLDMVIELTNDKTKPLTEFGELKADIQPKKKKITISEGTFLKEGHE